MADTSPQLQMPTDRVYTEFGATTVIVGSMGLAGMPVAGALGMRGPTVRLVRLAAPSCYKVITWASSALRGEPKCPHPDTGSANDVLLGFVIAAGLPGNLVDGTQLLATAGQYLYALQCPFTPGVDQFPRGTSPFVNTPAAMNWIDPSNFVKYLIGATPQLASEWNLQAGGDLNLSKIG